MSSNNCIIPECYIDSCLIEVLLHADKDYVNHQKGNGTVAREMKNKFGDAFCIGIIDEDRKMLDYLLEFNSVSETNSLKLWRHKTKHHYMIQMRPVIESWILSACEGAGILLKSFDLPDSLNELKKASKSVASKRDARFVRLFREMVNKDVKPVLLLEYWLEYLKAKKYNADINQLTNG